MTQAQEQTPVLPQALTDDLSRAGSNPLTVPASLEFRHWGYQHASRSHCAVQDFNLFVPAGQKVLLLGASGIGKSTILQGAAGLLGVSTDSHEDSQEGSQGRREDADGGVSQGSIEVGGRPVHQALGQVGLVLQDPDAQAIFQRVGDNVAFGPENMNLPRDQIWRRVRQSLEAVGLSDLQLTRSVTHLSGGQMQRLALAGALAMRPGVLLLDEPTANLDPSGVKQIVAAVRQVLQDQGSTMVLVEHRAEPWMDMLDRVVVLGLDQQADTQGFHPTRIVADGSPDEVFRDQTLDFESLGIWLPPAYRPAGGKTEIIHVPDEPAYPPDQGQGQPVLTTEQLAVGRQGRAIASQIALSFRAGQITALVGDNGAGKSTLALTLAGLLEPVSGQVQASPSLQAAQTGQAVGPHPAAWSSTELAQRICYVFQNPEHQFARGSVLEEVMVAPVRTGMSLEQAEQRGRQLLKQFQLLQYAQVNPYTLSGGEKRRLSVAAALAAAPQVLILDEPTFGQDKLTWTSMAELIASLRAQGVCIILVTHDRELVQALGARQVELIPQGSSGSWQAEADPSSSLHSLSQGQRVKVVAMSERSEEPRPASRSAYIASINPSFRLIGAFLIALPLFFSLDWLSALTALLAECVLLAAAGFTPWRIVKSTWPLFVGAPGSAIAVLLYGKAGGQVLWHWGLMNVSEHSAQLAAATALRILAIGIPAIVMMLGIDATDLADSFSQVLHLPDRFVYGGLAGMRLFSVLQDDWTALSASRRSRGLGDENKVKAFLPQAFALLVLSIRRSTGLATAMEARGFGGPHPRSHARVSVLRARDYLFLLICLAVPALALAVALWAGSFAFLGN